MKVIYLELDKVTYARTEQLQSFIDKIDDGSPDIDVNYNRKFDDIMKTDLLFVTTTDSYIKNHNLEEAFDVDYCLDPCNPVDKVLISKNFPKYNLKLIGTDKNGKVLE